MKLFRRRKDEKPADEQSSLEHTDKAPQQDSPTEPKYMKMMRKANELFRQGELRTAERLFDYALKQIEAQDTVSEAELFTQAMALAGLGRCYAFHGKFDQAVSYLRRALPIFESQQQSNADAILMLVQTNLDLGNNLARMRQNAEANTFLQRSFDIARHAQDKERPKIAEVFSQEGDAAFKRGNLPAAKLLYTETLSVYKKLGDLHKLGLTWHQIGRIGQLQAQQTTDQDPTKLFQAAEYCFQKAADLFIQVDDKHHLAGAYNQLATMAAALGRPDEAEQGYQKTITVAESTEAPIILAYAHNNLAELYLSQERLDEAEEHANRALDIKKTLDTPAMSWATYSILTKIAEARGQDDEALRWRRQEQESFAASPDAYHEIQRFRPLLMVIVGACQGNAEMQTRLTQVLAKMENSDESTRRFVDVVRRMQAGERDIDALTEKLNYLGAARIHALHAVLTGRANPHG